jgi:hypothetical protein
VTPSEHPQADALTRFTRGLGLARSGKPGEAAQEIAALRALEAALDKARERYWADRTREQILAVSAWISLADGKREEAITLMRRAADGEDGSLKHVAMENRLYPMRELLAELLLEAGQATAAAREYAKALQDYPNRYRALSGAARAAEATGDRERARSHYQALLALTAESTIVRPELQHARAYLSR